MEHHRQILEECIWNSNGFRSQFSHCRNLEMPKDRAGTVKSPFE